jgi:hypothetical protein
MFVLGKALQPNVMYNSNLLCPIISGSADSKPAGHHAGGDFSLGLGQQRGLEASGTGVNLIKHFFSFVVDVPDK